MAEPLHIVCPACRTANRVPGERLGQNPNCGKCGAPLLPAKPLLLDAAGLQAQLDKGDLPVLVDFWAEWCGPCRMMAPQFEQAAGMLHPRVRLAKVNSDENRELAGRLGIQSIPTMVLFRGGREVARVSGAMAAQNIAEWVRESL
jgi:thioredoxin 2